MAGVDPRAMAYRQMLVNLDKMVTPVELRRMVGYCKDVIGARVRDQIGSSIDLWEKLEERNLLSSKNLNFLKDMLVACGDGRQDWLDKVREYETQGVSVSNGTPDVSRSPATDDMKKEVQFLVNNLGRDWKFFMRSLGLPEAVLDMCMDSHPRNVREQIHMAFKEWMNPENGLKAEKKDLLRALKEVHRNDLHLKLAQGI